MAIGRTSTSGRAHRGVEAGIPVTARDGTVLLVDHHLPRVRRAPGEPARVVVWIRTPYGRRGMRSIAKRFSRRGAHVLVESLRGTDGSGGTFDGIRFDPTDGADVAAWLREQTWFPGTIVSWGHSGIGYASWALAGAAVPEWTFAILHDTQSDARSVVFPGGVFAAVMLSFVHAVEWLAQHPNASPARSLFAEFRAARRVRKVLAELPLGAADERLIGHRAEYFQQWLDHEVDEAYWQRLDLRPNVVRMPDQVHLTTGWYDTGLASTLADYAALREAGKAARLVVGPWFHGGGFMDKTYKADIDTCVDAVFRGEAALTRPSVTVHVGGVNQWRELPDWPPPGHRSATWHLQPHGGLSTEPPPESEPDRYRYDPADPTPAVGGAKENWDNNAGAKDNRNLERRDDVLTFTSDTLSDDVELIGPVSAEIAMRSSLEHTDLFVRLCDVDPRGRSTNLCDGTRRLRPDDPPTAADGSRRVLVDLIATAHRLRAGHRIRLQISSGAHPRLVRNAGTGDPLATATRLRAADQEILHDPAHPSTLTLPMPSPLTE